MLVLSPLDSDVGVLHARRVELCFCLGYVRRGSSATIEPTLSQLQRVLIGLDGVIEQPLLRVGAAQVEVVDREFGLQAKLGGLEIGSAGLSILRGRRNLSVDAAPEIDLVG